MLRFVKPQMISMSTINEALETRILKIELSSPHPQVNSTSNSCSQLETEFAINKTKPYNCDFKKLGITWLLKAPLMVPSMGLMRSSINVSSKSSQSLGHAALS